MVLSGRICSSTEDELVGHLLGLYEERVLLCAMS